MIQVFKLINGFDIAAPDKFVHKSFSSLRGHTLKLYKHSFYTNIGKYSFSNGIINCNNLLQHVVSSSTVNKVTLNSPPAIGINAYSTESVDATTETAGGLFSVTHVNTFK